MDMSLTGHFITVVCHCLWGIARSLAIQGWHRRSFVIVRLLAKLGRQQSGYFCTALAHFVHPKWACIIVPDISDSTWNYLTGTSVVGQRSVGQWSSGHLFRADPLEGVSFV